jgi:hypothetical protein
VVNSLLSTASDESVKEIQRNVRKAPEVKKPSLTYESLSDVAEAKVTRERSTKPHPSESSDCKPASCTVWKNDRVIIHQFIINKSSTSIVLAACQEYFRKPTEWDWWCHPTTPIQVIQSVKRNSVTHFLKDEEFQLTTSHFAHLSKAIPPEPFETNRLLGSKSLPPPSVTTSHPDKSLIAAIGSPTASTSETELISIDQKPGLSRQKTSQFPSDVKGMFISWSLL